ncbi:MAG TPA: nucleoside triphosphate pyrophosphohydrolase [Vicinamibacteria bacterium]|nr:nucleoside triphosphate pyrophosphohydrolase [Vicinamibacteria bacterium]
MSEGSAAPPGKRFEELVSLIARLRAPGGCPWDREQTHESLKAMAIEEAYEVVGAIDDGDHQELASELGDLLLQVVFHAQIAGESGRFGIADVLERVTSKMIDRHPHVFGDQTAENPDQVLRNWEALKEAERARKGAPSDASLLDSVPLRLPAVMEAFQMTTKAARVGFDWPSPEAVLDKLDQEVLELKAEVAKDTGNHQAVAGEMGDILFAAVNVARLLGVDPESALKAANRKFRNRFRYVEDRLREQGRKPKDADLAEMDGLWDRAKAQERRA